MKMIPTLLIRAIALTLSLACLDAPSGPLVAEGRRILFIGNSYLYHLDIPGIVQALADSAGGGKLAVVTVAGADMALVDHIAEGTAAREIAKGGWEWVVLQQGPSSVAVNRDTLRLATQAFAVEIAKVNAKPALFSAWPSEQRKQDFPAAIQSYTLAAADVGGILLPVAGAWLGAWSRDSALDLYDDSLHPSEAGAYLAALVVYGKLLGKSTKGLPSVLRMKDGTYVWLTPAVAATLQAAADSAVAASP